MGESHDTIDEFLEKHFPHVPAEWLNKVNDVLGWLKRDYSGNGQMITTWSSGREMSTKWTFDSAKRSKKKTT
jgi:hypothetical protein